MLEKETVCAVVVTYNRKQLLLECLESILKQAHPLDAIYLIDNASTDGTPEALKENGYIKEVLNAQKELLENDHSINMLSDGNRDKQVKVHYVRMHENTGGAGGFYEGVKRGYERGYEWLWLMDDDGYPSWECLETLSKYKDKGDMIGPLVISKNDKEKLSFEFTNHYSGKKIKYVNEAILFSQNKGVLENQVFAFNGILVSKKLIGSIGCPKKDFFFCGDEIEYQLRAIKAKFKLLTVVEAKYFHPEWRIVFVPVLNGLLGKHLSTTPLRLYCMQRNNLYIYINYFRKAQLVFYLVKHIIKSILYLDFSSLKISIIAWLDAIYGRWTRERKYLK